MLWLIKYLANAGIYTGVLLIIVSITIRLHISGNYKGAKVSKNLIYGATMLIVLCTCILALGV